MGEDDKQRAERVREESKMSRKKKPNNEVKRITKSFTQELKIGEESSREKPSENRRGQEIDSFSRTSRLASVPSKVDSWEKSQINKIRLRYEKMKTDIVGWETERKLAAKLKMEKRKSELLKRQEINNQHYKSKLARIQLIADGAKKQLEEKRRSKEAQVHENVKKMRSTGKVPINYFFFRCY